MLGSGWLKSSSKMVKNCQSLIAEVNEVAKKRKEVVNHQKAFRKEGWIENQKQFLSTCLRAPIQSLTS
eukprot:9806513-Ditylum_brightwellii.AAC.1